MSLPALAATLKVGDSAPKITVSKWVKGEPITQLEPGKIYVMEFWATWCGPCVTAIPHISELQERYKDKDVIVIGTSIWENETDQSKVEPFVTKMGDKMNYRVAMDDRADGGKGKMAEGWMAAAEKNGIPCSFIVDKTGKIAWIGHPMAMEKILEQVVAGTFDVAAQAAKDEAATAAAKPMMEAQKKIGMAMKEKNWDKVITEIDAASASFPVMKMNLAVTKFDVLLVQKKDADAAYALAKQISEDPNVNAGMLNAIAWTIVDKPGIEKRDLDLALKMAERAVDMSKRDPTIVDTLARAHFEKGNVAKAIELQTEAVGKAEGEMKAEFQKALDKYKSSKAN
jgi:thiol-disulfide isomerase/thioredoxin